jgi:hypothetical protein
MPTARPWHLDAARVRRQATSNFRMQESKISMRAVHAYNKIALPLCAGDAILGFKYKDPRHFCPFR